MPAMRNGLVRIYYFKGAMSLQGEGRVRMLGGNTSWTEEDSQEFANKVNYLTAAGYTIFTSPPVGTPRGEWNLDDVIHTHLSANFGPGLIEL